VIRRILRRLVPLVLGAVLALALAELLLRALAPRTGGFYVWPPGLERTFRPSPGVMPGVAGESRFRINSIGLRGAEPSADADPRILCVGGSTTECLYLDQAEAWPAVVEQRLGGRAWVANAGASGRLTRDHVVQLERLLPLLPGLDRAVLLVGVNDLMLALGQGEAYDPRGLDAPGAREEALRRAFEVLPRSFGRERFPRSTELWRLIVPRLRARLDRGQVQDEAGSVYTTWRAHRAGASRWIDALPDLGPALVEYRRNLTLLAEECSRHGVRLLALTQPCLWSERTPPQHEALLWMGGVGDYQKTPGAPYYTSRALAEGMERYNAELRAVCAELDVDCLDLAALLPRDTSVFYDDVHFNEAGARLVAEHVAAALEAGR
jgi:lysophospholipase L1-like esterase